MRAIADALEHLPNDEARARVLQWVAEFFVVAPVAPPRPAAKRGRARGTDPYLAVAELSSFFDADREPMAAPPDAADAFEAMDEEPPAPDPAPQADQGVVSMVHSFVADFQKLARDWQG